MNKGSICVAIWDNVSVCDNSRFTLVHIARNTIKYEVLLRGTITCSYARSEKLSNHNAKRVVAGYCWDFFSDHPHINLIIDPTPGKKISDLLLYFRCVGLYVADPAWRSKKNSDVAVDLVLVINTSFHVNRAG